MKHAAVAADFSHKPMTSREILERSHRYMAAVSGQVALMLASDRGLTRRSLQQMIEDLVAAQLLLRKLDDRSEM